MEQNNERWDKQDPYISHTTIEAIEYSCPNCGTSHNDAEDGYTVDGIQYPITTNESRGSDMDGSYWNWDEEHKCEQCGTLYWFRNGAY